KIGGLCKSHYIDGFTFDYTGHLLHFTNDFAKKIVFDLLAEELTEKTRNSYIFYKKKFIPFPFQQHLGYLSENEKIQCFIDFLDSYFTKKNNYKNFEDWALTFYGAGIAKKFMLPYNLKLYKYDLKKITTDWFGAYMPQLKLYEMLKSLTIQKNQYCGYNSIFYYPRQCGINQLITAVSKHLKNINCRAVVYSVNIQKKYIEVDNQKIFYDYLINTIPLPEFLKLLIPKIKNLSAALDKLEYTSVYNINYGIETNTANKLHWLYFPENKFQFYRCGFYHNFSKNMTPYRNQHSAYIEISYRKILQNINDLHRAIKNQFFDFGVYNKKNSKIILEFPLDIKYAYVIYNKHRKKIIEYLSDYFFKNSIISIGRYAEWNYSSMQDSIVTAYNKIINLNK
ncbi:MAG TPA: FAD-dependent oxidoreductase, partial [bacterium]|nr:FAD-dependent oxidoreductase [bacterium]